MEAVTTGFWMIGGVSLFAIFGTILARKIMHRHVADGHNEVLVPLFGTAGVLYAVLLGFLVTAIWDGYCTASDNIVAEASALVPLYRLTNSMTPKHGAKTRLLIRQYANAVIQDEWPTLLTARHGSSKAHVPLGELYRSFGAMDRDTKLADSAINAEFLDNLSTVVVEQNKRLMQAKTSNLPWVVWMGAIGGAIIVVAMSFTLYMEAQGPHVLMTTITAALIAMMVYMMVLMEFPFSGPLALDAAPFQETIKVFDEVDRGN